MTNVIPIGLVYKGAREDGSHDYEVCFDAGFPAPARLTVLKRTLDEFGNDFPEIVTSLDKSTNESLIKAVEDFDKAGHTFMFEHGPVTAEAPLTVPPPMRPIELHYLPALKEGRHQFILSMLQRNNSIKKYSFDVSPRPGAGVRYPNELFNDLGGCIDLAKPLLDAIRNFFIAGQPDLK